MCVSYNMIQLALFWYMPCLWSTSACLLLSYKYYYDWRLLLTLCSSMALLRYMVRGSLGLQPVLSVVALAPLSLLFGATSRKQETSQARLK